MNHLEDQLYYLAHGLDISQNSEKDKAQVHQFERNYYEESHLLCFIRRVEFGKKIGKFGVIKIYFRRLNTKEVS